MNRWVQVQGKVLLNRVITAVVIWGLTSAATAGVKLRDRVLQLETQQVSCQMP